MCPVVAKCIWLFTGKTRTIPSENSKRRDSSGEGKSKTEFKGTNN